MGFFSKKEKKDEEKKESCCSSPCECQGEQGEKHNASARVKVLGSGCSKCNALEAAAKEALAELGMDTAIDHVTDFVEIASYGVMTTPALVVDEKVVSTGKVLKKGEVIAILKETNEK